MKRKQVNPFQILLISLLNLTLLTSAGCSDERQTTGNGSPSIASTENSGTHQQPPSSLPKDSNACHLLDPEEVSALVENKIVMRDQVDAGQNWSTCEWQNENNRMLFSMTVYWTNGKQQWETWRAAQGLGNTILKQSEGISADEVVNQGPVPGIGDGAYFSELMPSLLLKGDVLFEMNLFFVPKSNTKFAALTRKLLNKIE